jgi:tetratricopeptide (TPR) repeat protein
LRALQQLSDSHDTLAQAIDLRLDLRAAFITTREFERLLAHLRAAETMAQTLGDERRLGRIYCYMANYFQQMGAHQRGIEFGQRALALAMARGDVETRVHQPAEGYYRQALILAQALGMRPLQAHCHLGLGMLHARTGQSEQAHTEITTAMDLYRALDMTFWLPQAGTVLVQIATQ